MRNKQCILAKEELPCMRPDSYGDYATVAVHINHLREEIDDKRTDSKHIITVV